MVFFPYPLVYQKFITDSRTDLPSSQHSGCAKRSPTSVPLVGGCEPSSDTSGWCACTPVCPVSGVLREFFQHPKADFPSPSLGSRRWFRRLPLAGVKRPLTCASNTSERAPDATAAGCLAEQ